MSYLAQYMGTVEKDPSADMSAVVTLLKPYGEEFTQRAIAYLKRPDPVPPDEVFTDGELEVVRALIRMSATFLLDPYGKRIDNVADVVAVMASIKYDSTESMYVVAVDPVRRLRKVVEVSKGSFRRTGTPVRVVWKALADVDAAAFFLVHNHPTAGSVPSDEDLATARFFASAGTQVGFRLVDSIIISQGDCSSIRSLHPELWTEAG